MASMKKISKMGVGLLFKHNNRTENDDANHSNETIDNELTHLNYWYKKGTPLDIHNTINENNYYYMNRANSNPIVEVVVTMPKDVKEEDEQKFFQSVYDFYCNDFGEKNVINAVVHKDEITPHMHLDFIPVVELDRNTMSSQMKKLVEEREKVTKRPITAKVSSKEVVTLEYLRMMHPRLSDWVEKDLGYRTEILNGATAGGNRTVLQLKNEFYEREAEKAKAEAEKQKENLDMISKNVQIILDKTNEAGVDKRYFDATAMLFEQARLIAERDVYKKALIANGITNVKIPDEVRDMLRQAPPANGKLTYKSGIIVPKSGEITVVETYIRKPRPLPQQYLLDNAPGIMRYLEQIRPREIKRMDDYLLFPTDDIEHTFHNLLLLKEKEKEFKKVNMPKISNDTFNIAEAVLRQCSFNTDYYYLEQNYVDELTKEEELNLSELFPNLPDENDFSDEN